VACEALELLQSHTFSDICMTNKRKQNNGHKGKGHPTRDRDGPRVPGRLRLRIFLTFGTTRLVGRQPYAPAAFTPGEIPVTHFQGLSRP
jgi:hypothetical protein